VSDARPKVLVTTRLFDDAAAGFLEQSGFSVVTAGLPPDALDSGIADDALARLLEGVAGWIVGMRAVTHDILAAHPQLKVVARRGVGYDRVDAAAARALGRVVTITAGANDASVADHTLALMLAVLRRLKENNAALAAGDWRVATGGDLTGKTVGLIGFGRTARAVARRLSGFDCRVLVAAPRFPGEVPDVTHVPLAQLLAESDVVSVHAPLAAETRHMIDAGALAAMKRGAILVNTARGGLVDDAALRQALASGHIAGAGLDVFEAEEDASLRPLAEALAGMPQVVATGHAAGSSREALARGNMIAAQCVVAVLNGTAPPAGCVVADGRPHR
jgi:D-3-phosphoglycerate dehydrogenase